MASANIFNFNGMIHAIGIIILKLYLTFPNMCTGPDVKCHPKNPVLMCATLKA